MIKHTLYLCKNDCHYCQIHSNEWVMRFIKDKWYKVEYQTWSTSESYKLNGNLHRRYWVIDETGSKNEISKAFLKLTFEFDINKLREEKLKQILWQ